MNRRGFIVLVVMVVIVMITLAGLSFVMTLSTENKAVHVLGDQMQLEQTLLSGVELMRGACSSPPEQRRQVGGIFDNDSLFLDRRLSAEDSADGTQFSVQAPRIANDVISGWRNGVQNESARLHLASLLDWERQEPGAAARALLNLPGMTEGQADAILDWIDTDSAPRAAGAESGYYAAQGLPYEPRNDVPAALEELLLVRDVTRLSLFGPETASTGDGTSGGVVNHRAATGAETGTLPWANLLTMYSAERAAAADGRLRINVNQKDLAKLHEELAGAFAPEWADFVILYRQYGPRETATASPPASPRPDPPPDAAVEPPGGKLPPGKPPGREPSAPRAPPPDPASFGRPERFVLDLAVPATHELKSVLDLVGVQVALPADEAAQATDAAPTIVDSPFEDRVDWLRAELPRLLDRTATTDEPVLRGRINVHEAPRCVLLGIPGMDAATADRIVGARNTIAADSDTAVGALWLLTEGIVDLPRMKALAPYITGGGDVFRAQVTATQERTGFTARAEVVIDATVSPPRQLYWKDLSLLR